MAGSAPVAALLGGIALVAGVAASLLHVERLLPVVCVFKATTGWPCLTCGGTRALMRLVELDPAGALVMNPLVAVGMMGLVPWAVADAALALRGQALVLELGGGLLRALKWAAVPLLAANWAYLIAAGR